MAASLHKFAISAPLKPGVNEANLWAISFKGLFGFTFNGVKWTMKISYLALSSGRVISTILSNRPGRVKAESKMSFLFVAARTMTVSLVENPSISTNIWFRVESFSSFLEVSLFLPIASISSIKMIEGAYCLALANSSLTRDAPRPTNISTNSEPET